MNSYTFGDLKIGLSHSFRVVVSEAMLDQYLAMTGDANEIHVDRDAARCRGFGERVVWGMLTSSFYSTLVGMHLPGKFALLSSIKVDFLSPAYAQDELVVQGEVSQLSEAVRAVTIQANIFANNRQLPISRARILVKMNE